MVFLDERTLPKYLQQDINLWKENESKMNWDLHWCELYGSINSAEHDYLISSEEAWYLRKKYLGLKNDSRKE